MNDSEQSATVDELQDGGAETWKLREEQLIKRQRENEADFAQQRAKFMDLYRQKEEELCTMKESLKKVQQQHSELQLEVNKLRSEMEELQTAAAIAEVGKEDEVAKTQRQYHEELASFQQILEEAVSQAQQNATTKYEAERVQWLKHQQRLESEVQELRAKLSQDREGFLTSITKTLQKRVGSASIARDDPDLEFNMKKAQEDAELLRSVVSPLEEEITSLKEQLRAARGQSASPDIKSEIQLAAAAPVESTDPSVPIVGSKVRELHLSLQTEKASRTDLEMYVDVLNAQKTALVDETDKLKSQLKDVCRLLEQERLDHTSLKNTWQMANDRFLESQRLIMSDLHRMSSVLTAEQRRQLADLKAKEAQLNHPVETPALSENSPDGLDNLKQDTNVGANNNGTSHSASSQQISREQENNVATESNSNTVHANVNSCLTEIQQRALAEPTAEYEESQLLVASALALASSSVSIVGKRLVSQQEWDMLQQELNDLRNKIGQPCDACAAFESQLRGAHDNEKQAIAQLNSMLRQLDMERQAMEKQLKYTQQLEASLQNQAEDTEKQIMTLANKQRESERFLAGVKQQLSVAQRELIDQLQKLTENREVVHRELTRLQEENDSLVGKHSKHAQDMQDETIDLPNTVEEMQLLVLKYREELITAKVGQEHQENLLKSEIMFLRDQLVAEQQERSTMEENLAQEISHLQQELGLHKSVGDELEKERKLRHEMTLKQESTQQSETVLKRTVTELESQILSLDASKSKLEAEIQRLKMKVSSLQVDLENSEAVQRDFVKLSQSLQIQLEKIRASENEVRWQHEEDVDECSNCKLSFSVTRRKHHCRHCGQIFCLDCLAKTVNSGPHQRPAKVCDVCHTILVRDATPYFCTEVLHTPD